MQNQKIQIKRLQSRAIEAEKALVENFFENIARKLANNNLNPLFFFKKYGINPQTKIISLSDFLNAAADLDSKPLSTEIEVLDKLKEASSLDDINISRIFELHANMVLTVQSTTTKDAEEEKDDSNEEDKNKSLP